MGSPKEDIERNKVDKAQLALDSSKEAYERVTVELQNEFEVFKSQKANEIRDIMLKWVEINIQYCQRAQETWDNLIPTLNTITTYVDDGAIGYHHVVAEGHAVDTNPFPDNDSVGV